MTRRFLLASLVTPLLADTTYQWVRHGGEWHLIWRGRMELCRIIRIGGYYLVEGRLGIMRETDSGPIIGHAHRSEAAARRAAERFYRRVGWGF